MNKLYSKAIQLLLHKENLLRLFTFGPIVLLIFLANLVFVSYTAALMTPVYFFIGFMALDLLVYWFNSAQSLTNQYRQTLTNKLKKLDTAPPSVPETTESEAPEKSVKTKQIRKSSIPAPALIVSDPPIKKKVSGRGRPKSTNTDKNTSKES